MRKARVIKEGIVTKQYEVEVFTPSLEDVPSHAEEVEGKIIQARLTAESREGMKKRAVATQDAPGFGTFSIWCDESTALGGEDSAPAPLTYFGAAIAFWLLTQLSLYGKAGKLNIKETRLEQRMRFFQKGSMKDGTAQSGVLGLETYVHVDSDEPPERIRELIKVGEQTCYTVQSLVNPVPVQTYVKLNGEDLQLAEEGTWWSTECLLWMNQFGTEEKCVGCVQTCNPCSPDSSKPVKRRYAPPPTCGANFCISAVARKRVLAGAARSEL